VAPLRRLVHAYTRESGVQDDLFQEIALALWTALPQFRGDASERTWLYRVAHNTAIRFMTRQTRRSRVEQPGDLPHEPVSAADPERSAIDGQQVDNVLVATRRANSGRGFSTTPVEFVKFRSRKL